MMKRLVGSIVAIIVGTAAASPTVSLQLTDRQQRQVTQVVAGTPLQLTVTMRDSDALPDCSPDMRNIGGQMQGEGVQTMITYTNGRRETIRTWQYTFIPTAIGTLLVGPIALRCTGAVYQTNVAKIVVHPSAGSIKESVHEEQEESTEALRAFWHLPSGSLVQGQVVPLTIVIESSHLNLQAKIPAISLPMPVLVEDEPQTTVVVKDGVEYTRIMQRYVVQMPQALSVTLPSVKTVVQYDIVQSIFGWFQAPLPSQEVVIVPPRQLSIAALPQHRSIAYVGIVSLLQRNSSATTIRADQAVTVTMEIVGTGVPYQDIVTAWPTNILLYASGRTVRYNATTREYTTRYEWIVQPQQEGSIIIPAISFTSYDPVTHRYAEHFVDALTISVTAAPINQQEESFSAAVAGKEHAPRLLSWYHAVIDTRWWRFAVLLVLLLPFIVLLWIGLRRRIWRCYAMLCFAFSLLVAWLALLRTEKQAIGATIVAWRRYAGLLQRASEAVTTAAVMMAMTRFLPVAWHPAWYDYCQQIEKLQWSQQEGLTVAHKRWILRVSPWHLLYWYCRSALQRLQHSWLRWWQGKWFVFCVASCWYSKSLCATDPGSLYDLAALYRAWYWPTTAVSWQAVVQQNAAAVAVWQSSADYWVMLRQWMVTYAPWSIWQLGAMLLSIVITMLLLRSQKSVGAWLLLPWWLIALVVIGGSEYQKLGHYGIVTQSSGADLYGAPSAAAVVLWKLPQYTVVTCSEKQGAWCMVRSAYGTGMVQQQDLIQL
ncbi:BatD family protein [Candidatus Dependentiae bacterium]|nr:BatD family protein [Candidatus Dependentiae bacterium]